MKQTNLETFEHNGDEYYPIVKRYTRAPIITACPEITWEKGRQYIARGKLSGRTHVRVKITPRFARFWKIVNFPFYQFGGPQVSIVGNYGEGKSVLMNLFLAFLIAKKLRILMFNDRRFEARNLAMHGWFDKKEVFHPFIIDCFVPKGYEFDLANPLWEHRENVHKIEWTTTDDIMANLKEPNHLTVVYDECFGEKAKIKLWIALMRAMGRTIRPTTNYMFAHHELSSLIPEVPTKNIVALVREAANVALGLRKDRIGLMTTFHMQSEVFYRISQKFGFVIQKRPVNRKHMSQIEKDARKYKKSEAGISIAGYWTKHKIGYFPEMDDAYRLIPLEEKLTYPALTPEKKTDIDPSIDEKNFAIMQLRLQGYTYDEIATKVGLAKGTVIARKQKLGVKG